MCENLYGVFGFILFDSNQKKVYIGRDTYGVSEYLFKLKYFTKLNYLLRVC